MAQLKAIALGQSMEELLEGLDSNLRQLDSVKAEQSAIPTRLSQLANDQNYISDSGYVHTDNNFTQAEKEKLAALTNYILPVGGNQLGGVKNGGNVVIQADGTMRAPEGTQTDFTLFVADFTQEDSGWTQTEQGWQLTLATQPIQWGLVWRQSGGNYSQVLCDISLGQNQAVISAPGAFTGRLIGC